MAYVLTDESNYEDIADAIREKTESSDTYTPGEMAAAIRGIQTGGDVTGVKGNAESTYRTGDVNITPANIGAVALDDAVTGVKGNAESTYRKGNVNLTPANIGAKALQAAVASPSASGTAIEFIDTISQDAQGVITPTKKTVRTATENQSGLMSATDKAKLNGIESGAQVNTITGIKGDAEAAYRTGNVNLTPEDIGSPSLDDFAASEAKRMAMYPTGTLTGPVAAFPDGAEDVPVQALTVSISSQTGVTGLTLTHTGKNLLPLTVEGIKAANTSGTWDGTAYTVTGVTHTILTDTDGNVTGIRVSGSPTGSRTLFKLSDHMAEFATILSGCPAGGSANSFELQFNGTKRDFGSGASIAGDGTTGSVYIIIRPGYTASDLVFTPMIRAASIEDSTFEPYHSETYTFDWSEEAGAITEGTLDVLTGILETGGDTHSLTPAEVLTMLGANTIYADHGDVSVTYRADPTLQHDNLDGGDVRYIPYLGVYGNNTVGKALRDMEGTIVNMNNDIGSLQRAILGDKLLVFNQDGTVSWEEAPV